jgi:hypothetical protein
LRCHWKYVLIWCGKAALAWHSSAQARYTLTLFDVVRDSFLFFSMHGVGVVVTMELIRRRFNRPTRTRSGSNRLMRRSLCLPTPFSVTSTSSLDPTARLHKILNKPIKIDAFALECYHSRVRCETWQVALAIWLVFSPATLLFKELVREKGYFLEFRSVRLWSSNGSPDFVVVGCQRAPQSSDSIVQAPA